MSIDFDKFLEWAESRFDSLVTKGDEIKLNSIFCDDIKHHLWCNPYGGKTGNQNGVYHCWKTDQKGSLVNLVMLVDKCSYEEALETLNSSCVNLYNLEKRVQELFEDKNINKIPDKKSSIELPPNCYSFDDLPSSHYLSKAATDYLRSRKINTENLLVCTRGRYKNRIVIPYYDKNQNLIYYNGRYVGESGNNLRYLGPPKELGIGKGDVLYCPKWPKQEEKIYLTEGEFDALSLFSCGFYSCALGGKSMTERQSSMLKEYQVVLCLDADQAGAEALPKIASFLISKGFKKIYYVRPCKEYKDWNGLLVEKGEKILKEYIRTQEKEYSGEWGSTRIAIKNMIN